MEENLCKYRILKHVLYFRKKAFIMGDILRKIEEIEYEMSKTQKNKVCIQ